jgi:hypothetical protein
MVVIAALTFALGITLARFYKVSVLLPATFVIVAGVSVLELAGGHTFVYALLSILFAASALQAGFMTGSLLFGLIVGVTRAASTAAQRPK